MPIIEIERVRVDPADVAPVLLAAAIAFGAGECLHTTVLSPLVADLAPPALRGRYMATIGVSFWLGLALAPTLLLSVSPSAALLVAAAVALAAGLSALALERELPAATRLTPRPAGAAVSKALPFHEQRRDPN